MTSQKEKFLDIINKTDFHQIKDHPNILIAATFWEEDRYNAAIICYKFMRMIDDLIDNYKTANQKIAPEERGKLIADVTNWLRMAVDFSNNNPQGKELAEIIKRFRIPVWPLEAFARSMIYDINNDGFPSLEEFLDYAQGASVAPASIFVHLAGLTCLNGEYSEPGFDVRESATPCAIFSYIVHIIRDFQKDQMNNLNYFPESLMAKYGLSRVDLREIANGQPVTSNFRSMIREYLSVADEYRQKTSEMIKKIRPLMSLRHQISLEVIFELYMMVFERIDVRNGKFTEEELNPTPEETKQRVYKTIDNFIK